MSITTQKLTFEEYLDYEDESDNLYEFVDGDLILMAEPSGLHEEVVDFLTDTYKVEIQRLSLDLYVKQGRTGVRTRPNRNRHPDVMVITKPQLISIIKTRAVLETFPPLVVEVVSPGEKSRKRDYKQKSREYQAFGIPEYWIVDNQEEANITVLLLVEGIYEEAEYRNSERIVSRLFPELTLTVEEVLGSFNSQQ